ncbi:MAG: cytochrome c biogenesis protein CcsA [Armatimonadota bacterium]|nr:cytochrome c biogenesis protein CcsA [Armatimonadota bacterium]MDR5702836.1 cytochrome c biogenesis protein CcsA [Armatimonadota bacterium]
MARGFDDRAIAWVLLVAMVVSLYMVFLYVPTEREMGIIQRIFYFHVPLAWISFLAFLIVCIAGIQYLRQRSRWWDALGTCAAEIGVLFSTLVLITGSIWAKPIWGTWWTWEPRLVTFLILWFIYVGYLLLRAAAGDDERKARLAAVVGIVGFLDVPLVFFSARLLRGLSPVVFTRQGAGLAPPMLWTLLVSLATFTLLFVLLLRQRLFLELARDEVEALKELIP